MKDDEKVIVFLEDDYYESYGGEIIAPRHWNYDEKYKEFVKWRDDQPKPRSYHIFHNWCKDHPESRNPKDEEFEIW